MVTEKRLIDGNKAQKVLLNMAEHLLEAGNPVMAGAVGYAAEMIGNQNAVDAVEVIHGRWIRDQVEVDHPFLEFESCWRDVHQCSSCKEYFDVSDARNYCPNCGAKMDGDGNA